MICKSFDCLIITAKSIYLHYSVKQTLNREKKKMVINKYLMIALTF